jgi:hypothetical protein
MTAEDLFDRISHAGLTLKPAGSGMLEVCGDTPVVERFRWHIVHHKPELLAAVEGADEIINRAKGKKHGRV